MNPPVNDDDLDRIFSVPLPSEAPPLDPLAPVMCNKLDCRLNDCGACLQYVTQDFDGAEGECLDYSQDEAKCDRCGAERQEVRESGYGADADGRRGRDVVWLECRNC